MMSRAPLIIFCIILFTLLSTAEMIGQSPSSRKGRNDETPARLFRKGRGIVKKTPMQHQSLSAPVAAPLSQDFESPTFPPSGWSVVNPDIGSITWGRAAGVSGYGNGNGSTWMDFYDYQFIPGDRDKLRTPVILGLTAGDSLVFDYAYAEFDDPFYGPDSLIILLSTDAGSSFPVQLYANGGAGMATAPATPLFYTPSPVEWVTVRIGLPPSVTGGFVMISFESINGYGNNLYLDNIFVGSLPANDVQALNVLTPAAGSKQRATVSPSGTVRNAGTATQTNIPVRYQILIPSGSLVYNMTSSVSSLAPGGSQVVTFPDFAVPSTPGTYITRCITEHPGDGNAANDTAVSSFHRPANLSGLLTVGSGGMLQTLRAAVDTLNNNDVAGPLTFRLISATYTESSPLTIRSVTGSGPSSSVTFSPAPGIASTVYVEGSAAEPYALGIIGSRYVIIDGSPSAEALSPRLTINALGADGRIGVFVSGLPGASSSYVTLKGLSIRTGADSTVPSTGYFGVFVLGADPTQKDTGVSIASCDITDHGQAGIATQYTEGLVIDQCVIHDWTQTGGFTDLRGIWLSLGTSNSIIRGTTIARIRNTVNNWWAFGIQNDGSSGSGLLCYNNMITGISSTGSGADVNIAAAIFNANQFNSNDRYYYNSILIDGVDGSSSSLSRSSGFEINAPPPQGLIFRNNIVHTISTHAGGNTYAVFYPSSSWLASDTSNRNNWSVASPQGHVGYFNGTARTTLFDWQSATAQDANSVSADPLFVSQSNLHIATGSSPVSNGGTLVPGITVDFDGEPRSGLTPDIGADEFSSSHIVVSVPVTGGWNLISNPVRRGAGTDSVRHLFPGSTFTYAYRFDPAGGYQQTGVLNNRPGFWGKFGGAGTTSISGDMIAVDTFFVAPGWNIVGSISSIVDTSLIQSNPPGLRASSWFGYSGAYFPAGQIEPGKAYWVKAREAGYFLFTSPGQEALRHIFR